MPKLTIDDLKKIKEKYKATETLREGKQRFRVTVHMGTCGIAAGARDIMQVFIDEMGKNNVNDVALTNSGCAGLCSKEPMITIEEANKPPVKYADLNKEKAQKIFKEHIMEGKIVENLALVIGSETSY